MLLLGDLGFSSMFIKFLLISKLAIPKSEGLFTLYPNTVALLFFKLLFAEFNNPVNPFP